MYTVSARLQQCYGEIGNELENFDPMEFDDLSPEDILELSQVSPGKLFNTLLIHLCF